MDVPLSFGFKEINQKSLSSMIELLQFRQETNKKYLKNSLRFLMQNVLLGFHSGNDV
jgi:hypothetical protein